MPNTDQSPDNADQAKPLPPIAENPDSATTPQEQEITSHYLRDAKQFVWHYIGRPVAWIIRVFDAHNGLLTAIATIAVAFLTYYVAKYAADQGGVTARQLYVMQGQLDEMQAEQRPWIKTEATATTDLSVDHTPGQEQSVFVMIGLDLTNTGKTPAFFALPNNGSGERFLHNVDIEQSNLCSAFDGPNAAKIPEDGLTVFPGQTKTYRIAVTIPPVEVTEIKRRAKGQSGPITVTPIVYGCISYKSSPGGKWHLSGFAYVVDTKKMTRVDLGLQTIGKGDLEVFDDNDGRNPFFAE